VPHSSPWPPPPPPPDLSPIPRFIGHGLYVLECLYSVDKRHRVYVIADAQKSFHVFCETWDTSEWHASGAASWRLAATSGAKTGNLSDARQLARARLGEFESQLD